MSKAKISGIDTRFPNEVQVPHLEVDTVGGEVFFHKEKEILTRLERLETKIKAWTEGMTDLNGRMKAVKEYVEGVNGILDKQKDLEFALGQSFADMTNKADKLSNNAAFLLDDNKGIWVKLAALQVDINWLKNQVEGANIADMAMSRDIQEMKKAQDFLRDENYDRSTEQKALSLEVQEMKKILDFLHDEHRACQEARGEVSTLRSDMNVLLGETADAELAWKRDIVERLDALEHGQIARKREEIP